MAEKYGKKVRALMIKEMETAFAKKGFIFSSYSDIKASDITAFRKKVRSKGSKYFVVKKRLGKKALEKKGISGLDDMFKDKKHVGITTIESDPVEIAKLLKEFAKLNKNFTVSGGCLEGNVLGPDRVKELADLPSREVLIAKVLGTMNAPVTSFVGVLSSLLRSVCYTINAIKDKKESGK
jgi:large subunit ribosomal protein L10